MVGFIKHFSLIAPFPITDRSIETDRLYRGMRIASPALTGLEKAR